MARFNMTPKSVFETLGKYILVDGFHLVADLERSHGSYLYDAYQDREVLDFYSYFASLPIGHNHPRLTEDAEFLAALHRAALENPANSDIYTTEYAAFVDTFSRVAVPESFCHLFFVAGGALAVENALKASFDWKTLLNQAQGRSIAADKVIHFREAFHGRSGYTMSLTNTDPVKTERYPVFDWPRITNPKIEHPVTEESTRRTEVLEDRAVAEIEGALERHPHEVAAIIIEPIQGEGGDNHFRGEFLRRLRKLADEHELMLIFDEVQTGLGLTGKMWAWQHFGATPDIVAFGKKVQVCGIMATDRIDQVAGNVFAVPGRINSTWGGNLVDMVRATRYLEVIEDERLVENAAAMGELLLSQLRSIERRHQLVSAVRGRGLFAAFTLPSTDLRNRLRQICWDNGLATLPSGPRSVRFRPCLNVSDTEVTRAMEILEQSLSAIE